MVCWERYERDTAGKSSTENKTKFELTQTKNSQKSDVENASKAVLLLLLLLLLLQLLLLLLLLLLWPP